jgi:hypothetical protein
VTEWNGAIEYVDGWPDNKTIRTRIDTLMDGYVYKKVGWSLFLREDTTKGILYLRSTDENEEFVIANMSLSIGDTITLKRLHPLGGNLSPETYKVERYDTIDNVFHIYLLSHNGKKDIGDVEFIEGVGCSNIMEFFSDYYAFVDGALFCCHKDGELVYQYNAQTILYPSWISLVDSCRVSLENIEKIDVEPLINVSPNPCTNFLTIEGKGVQSASLYDIMGKKVAENNSATKIFNTGKLPKGIYLLRISGNNFIATRQIIKR